ncbi:TatD DNase family protein [Anseongella ginsenosidimutans]|uniref:TatD DNase family protein n=1 Tax=Anseongella ginsenosidimutans TaxID=496056 RepID=A0A4R3KPF1_9SPHI|nr:TatD family hydrolase [Anseongella ginsenosidimutans]QEC54083.1 TatD family deoxyribonuclease [Anseongella ginsenosidimutans]TCS85147.1 TatD DNase family protein [Anseongella ginsenosidimutans]
MLTDTHTHLYLPDFDGIREEVMKRAFEAGVERMFLPNIDPDSIDPLIGLCRQYPENCFPMLGLHPCSVKAGFLKDLEKVERAIEQYGCLAIGEIGIDLYWDTSLLKEQEEAFRIQVNWAIERDLPVVIHSRESFKEICGVLEEEKHPRLRGIFHCFTGTYEDACRAIDMGFYLGIGGVITFKKSELPQVLSKISLDHVVLETDSPYLAPAPYRGKKNESSFLVHIAARLADIYDLPEQEIAARTTANSRLIFGI